jgi:hypothetical protein
VVLVVMVVALVVGAVRDRVEWSGRGEDRVWEGEEDGGPSLE